MILLPPSFWPTIECGRQEFDARQRMRVFELPLTFWPGEIESAWEKGELPGVPKGCWIQAADEESWARFQNRLFSDCWWEGGQRSLSERLIAALQARGVTTIVVFGSDRLTKGSAGNWANLLEQAAKQSSPLHIVFVIPQQINNFLATRLPRLKAQVAECVRFTQPGVEDLMNFLDGLTLPSWRLIKGDKAREDAAKKLLFKVGKDGWVGVFELIDSAIAAGANITDDDFITQIKRRYSRERVSE